MTAVTVPPPPSLAELHAQLLAARQAYPALRQGLGAALADVEAALTGERPRTRRDRRRVHHQRTGTSEEERYGHE